MNNELISLVESGDYSLQEIGKKLGIKKGMVSYLYTKQTGKKPKYFRIKQQRKRLSRKREELHKIAFVCRLCAQIVTHEQKKRFHVKKHCASCVQKRYYPSPKNR